jgi:hypothetical protein
MKHDTKLYFCEHEVDFSAISSEMSECEIIDFREMAERIGKIIENLNDMQKWLDKYNL